MPVKPRLAVDRFAEKVALTARPNRMCRTCRRDAKRKETAA